LPERRAINLNVNKLRTHHASSTVRQCAAMMTEGRASSASAIVDVRKATLRSLLVKTEPGLRWNEHIEGDGAAIFRHACKLGLEGIVSKRKDSPYRSGRSPDWLNMKNRQHPR
jgi:hypothetical protein